MSWLYAVRCSGSSGGGCGGGNGNGIACGGGDDDGEGVDDSVNGEVVEVKVL